MTGFWFPWSGKYCGGGKKDGYGDPNYPDGPERFRDAYRHIIDLFKQQKANHITWFFHPDIQRWPDEEWNSAKYYYPGDDYIDWIGISIYGTQFVDEDWVLFSDQLKRYEKLIDDITQIDKPLAILEFGVMDGRADGTKKEWLENAFATIKDNPYLKFSAITYWHENWINKDGTKSSIRIDSSKQSLKTFQNLIADEDFISKSVFGLSSK
jgi:beta-mannanase